MQRIAQVLLRSRALLPLAFLSFGFAGSTASAFAPANNGNAFCFGDGTGQACPCGSIGAAGEGCANSTGSGATLTASGSASVSNDTFSLQVAGVPSHRPGLILRALTPINNGFGGVLGDGLLCIAGHSLRSQVQVTAAGGTTFSDFQGSPFGASQFAVGVETNYQFWYRDSGNTCTDSGFNFSNAWSVTWTL